MLQEPDSFIGTYLADLYEVHSLIGEGGFAWVFRASDAFQKTVAVKVLHSSNPNALARFRREIEVLKALPLNPHVPRYFDAGVTKGGQPFLVLEYIEGRNLVGAMKKQAVFQPKEAVKIVVDLCQALVGLHQLGVAHRDIKPENVMLADQGLIKLIDFGLVRDAQGILQLLEQESHHDQAPVFSMDIDRLKVAGTPEYMAPEQFSDAFEASNESARTDTWSDVFSLGVILYELIAKNVPFPIDHSPGKVDFTTELVRYIRWRLSITDNEIPKCSAMDTALESIVHKTLRRDPRQRQANAQMLKRDLQQYLQTGRGISRRYGARTVNMQVSTAEFVLQTSSGVPSDRESVAPELVSPKEPPPAEVHVDKSASWERSTSDIARPIIIISDTNQGTSKEPRATPSAAHEFIDAKSAVDPPEERGDPTPVGGHRASDAIETGDSSRSTLLDIALIEDSDPTDDTTVRDDPSDSQKTLERGAESFAAEMSDEYPKGKP